MNTDAAALLLRTTLGAMFPLHGLNRIAVARARRHRGLVRCLGPATGLAAALSGTALPCCPGRLEPTRVGARRGAGDKA